MGKPIDGKIRKGKKNEKGIFIKQKPKRKQNKTKYTNPKKEGKRKRKKRNKGKPFKEKASKGTNSKEENNLNGGIPGKLVTTTIYYDKLTTEMTKHKKYMQSIL